MGSIKIAPSVLSADMANLKGELDKIAGADYVHFDVMDGHFTGNLTFGVDILKAVKRSTDVPVDAHLMVSNPDETVDWYADAGADTDGDHHVLQREGQRNGGQRTFADMRDEDGVHNIIKCLDQHRDHHRDAQLDEQRVDGHGAHDVFLGGGGIGLLVFHDFSL